MTINSEVGCRASEECPSQKACINSICVDICADPRYNPCVNQECQVIDHQAVCVKGMSNT